jgi:hypothetical protein
MISCGMAEGRLWLESSLLGTGKWMLPGFGCDVLHCPVLFAGFLKQHGIPGTVAHAIGSSFFVAP